MLHMSRLAPALIAAALMLSPAVALSQAFPTKTVRLILPFPPGGPTDLLGRSIAQKLSEQMGQQVVPENRPGAGGNLGIEVAAKSPPDANSLRRDSIMTLKFSDFGAEIMRRRTEVSVNDSP